MLAFKSNCLCCHIGEFFSVFPLEGPLLFILRSSIATVVYNGNSWRTSLIHLHCSLWLSSNLLMGMFHVFWNLLVVGELQRTGQDPLTSFFPWNHHQNCPMKITEGFSPTSRRKHTPLNIHSTGYVFILTSEYYMIGRSLKKDAL